MHISVHSASSHTGSVQITISFWMSEFRFHPDKFFKRVPFLA